MITDRTKESYFGLFLLIVVVKDAALTNNLEVWHETTLLKLRDSNHTYLKYFLDYSRYSESGDLYFASVLHKMVEVVNVSNLAWNRYTFCILCPNLSVVNKSIVCSFTELTINQIAANHHPSSALAGLAVNCCNIFGVFRKKSVQILTEINHEHENWRVVVIKRVGLRAETIERLLVVFAFRT